MDEKRDIKMGHSYTSLKCHIVFSTKYRLPWITAELEPELYAYVCGIIRKKGCRMIEIGGIEDHVHILTAVHQSRSVASLVGAIKSNSSSFSKTKSDNESFSWQSGYAAFSVSESQVPKVSEYIRNQKRHHLRMSYEEELQELCRRHGMRFDESLFKVKEPDEPGP